jgi:hypothetical protein
LSSARQPGLNDAFRIGWRLLKRAVVLTRPTPVPREVPCHRRGRSETHGATKKERHVCARRGWAGDNADFFNSLLGSGLSSLRRRFIDDTPKHAELFHGRDELLKLDRFDDIGIGAERVALG